MELTDRSVLMGGCGGLLNIAWRDGGGIFKRSSNASMSDRYLSDVLAQACFGFKDLFLMKKLRSLLLGECPFAVAHVSVDLIHAALLHGHSPPGTLLAEYVF